MLNAIGLIVILMCILVYRETRDSNIKTVMVIIAALTIFVMVMGYIGDYTLDLMQPKGILND